MTTKLHEEGSFLRPDFKQSKKTEKNCNLSKSVRNLFSTVILALLIPLGVFAQGLDQPPQLALDNVAEASNFGLLYQVDMPDNACWTDGVPYAVDNSNLSLACFDQVAYFVVRDDKWIWVSMDAFTSNLDQLGLPQKDQPGKDFIHQRAVSNLSVVSSISTLNRQNVSTGNIEIWNYGYETQNSLGLPNANNNTFDYDDTVNQSASFDYSSFQVHDYGAGEVLFAYNGWGTCDSPFDEFDDLGIGNNPVGPTANTDYTFENNTGVFGTKKLYILVGGASTGVDLTCNDIEVALGADGTVTVNAEDIYNIGDLDCVANIDVSQLEFDCSHLGDNTVTVTVADSNGNVTTCEAIVTVMGGDVSSCVMIAKEEIHLHGDNDVISGNVCVTNSNGKIMLHDNTHVAGAAKGSDVEIDNNSSAGSVMEMPADAEIPQFYANPFCDTASIEIRVEANEAVTLDGQIYKRVEVKEGGEVTFTNSNVFICDLKTEKSTTLNFTECANLFVKMDINLMDMTSFNAAGNNVTVYAEGNVNIRKGSNVNAHIYNNDREIVVEGDANNPTYMTGLFTARKIKGDKYVTWESNAYCNPCPVDIPPLPVDCECKGGMTSVTIEYAGSEGTSISSNSGTVTNNGDGTYTIYDNGEKLDGNLEIYVGGNTAEIHTSCSQDVLGVTYAGSVTVIGYTDNEGNIGSLDGCTQAPVPDCECKGGMTAVTFSYDGELADLGANSGSISDNGDGTFTVSNNGVKLENNLEITANGSIAEIHTSCSDDILGVTYQGGITVVGHVDTEGSVTDIATCPVDDAGIDCECKGGIVSVTFEYAGDLSALSSSDDNAYFTDNGDGTFTIATFNGAKLSDPDIYVSGNNVGEFHASCSQNLLGVVFGDITVVEYVDKEGGVSSIDTCPVECECKGGLVEITVSYGGAETLTSNDGVITDNGNGTFTITATGNKLEGNLEIYVGGNVAEIHTSCSQDILGMMFSGGVMVIKHIDSEGNICKVDGSNNGNSGDRIAGQSGSEDDKEDVTVGDLQDVITGFNVKAWPIPSDNAFNIRVASANIKDKVTIQVIDITGKLVHVDSFDANNQYQFGDKLQSGIYFVRIEQGNNLEIKRVVKH